MSQGSPPQTPAQIEQTSLNTLERSRQIFSGRLGSAVPANRALSPAEILSIINYCQQIEEFYQRHEPTAQQLDAVGLHSLSQWLSKNIGDIRGAKQVYFEMYQNAVRAAQARSAIWAKTRDEVLGTQLAMIRNQREAFDRMNREWFEANEIRPTPRYCPHCGDYLGNYQTYYYCPKCGRML